MLCLSVLRLAMLTTAFLPALVGGAESTVQQWDTFELSLKGPAGGNPFTEVTLSARFARDGGAFEPEGFYDGNGVHRVRFVPNRPGVWPCSKR